ncbi:UNVERIFIED_CONTAM: hypothetical protein Sindi_0734200 [Sesamum indicum]
MGVRGNAQGFLKGKDDLTEMISEDAARARNAKITFRLSICIQFVPPFLRIFPMNNSSFLLLSLQLEGDIKSVNSEKSPCTCTGFKQTTFIEVMQVRLSFVNDGVGLECDPPVLTIISELPYVPEDQDRDNISDVWFSADSVFPRLEGNSDVIGLRGY